MGIMPADRELKWQRVFRRFGLPGDSPAGTEKPKDKPENHRRGEDSARDKGRDGKPVKTK